MTLDEGNESYAGGLAADLGNNANDGTASGSGGDVMTGGNAFPSGFGSVKTPMYFKSVPIPKTTAVSPYGNFIDVSSKEQKLLWREMVKPDADFVPLDMTVANSKAIIDLFTDKAITSAGCASCVFLSLGMVPRELLPSGPPVAARFTTPLCPCPRIPSRISII